MARHDQKVDDRHFTCSNCTSGRCDKCVDVVRSLYSDEMICRCKRKSHLGEPRDKQVLDPDTGTVYAPGLSISIDGEVEHNA